MQSTAHLDALSIIIHANIVVKLVLAVLAIASIWSWTVILEKVVRFAGLNGYANRFEEQVGSGRSLEDIAAAAGDAPAHALPRMLQAALKEWRDTRSKGLLSGGAAEAQTAFLIQRIDRVLDSVIAREAQRVENGLSLLAIVATASPFIGLFGTVWGIMSSFQSIAAEKNTNLTVVAPGIAEALLATAVGLGAAIPAYIAYNKFSGDAGKYTARLEGFADDLVTAIQRRLAERT